MKQGKELVDLAIRYIQDFEFVEAGQVIKLDFSQAINLFIAAYNDGVNAGQASRTPIKWPTEKEIEKAMDEKDEAREEFCDCKFSHDFGFARGVQWLKSFIEEGQGE